MLQADLLANFYAATADRARLTVALDRVREITNAASATLHVFQRSATRLRHQWAHPCSQTPASVHALANLDDENPRTISKLNPPSTTPCLLDDAGLPDMLLPQLRNWQEQLRGQGMGRFIAARVSLDQHREVGLALHAKLDGSVVAQGTSELMMGLMPHLREVVLLSTKMDADARKDHTLRIAFERMRPGLVTISGNGQLMSINRSARELLGLSATATCLPPSLHSRIAVSGEPGLLCWKTAKRHLHISFEPLSPAPECAEGIGLQGQTWLLAIRDVEEQVALSGCEWAGCYGLTRAEIAVLGSVAGGADLAEVANERAISIHTARTQLKSVMAKVGARRQSQLVHLALNSPARWLGSRS